ncbi:MAG: radical SAM protein [Candidatus Scalindua sp.]|nr:radical SAM protein [Candidatus Scalindua sp.]
MVKSNIKPEPFPLMVLKRILHKPARFPYFVQLDITNACNLTCKMCPIHHVGIEKTHIEYETFKKIIDRLEGVKEISLVGLGEPLTHPRILDSIKYCKAKGMIVKITSNGLLLNSDKKIREIILSGLDTISFSLESINGNSTDEIAHRDKEVLKNIKMFCALKEEMEVDTPKISFQTVLFKDREQDVYDVIEWGANNNIHRINVLRMHMYFDNGLERPGREKEKEVFREFSRLRKKYNVRIDCLQDQFFTGFMGFLYKHFKYFLRMDSCCTRLLDYPLINHDGDMLPCCVLPNSKFGNVLEEDINDIWHGDRINNFRRNHQKVKTCSKCDCWRVQQIVEDSVNNDQAKVTLK